MSSMKIESPLRRWEVLASIAQSVGARNFVEVGCKEGRTTGYLLQNMPKLEVFAIDPWAPVPNADEDYASWDFKAIEDAFWKNVGEHRDRCRMLRMTSLEAARTIADNSIDMVFIDAGHDYKSCLEDIRAWLPKVHPRGILAGHDYQHQFPGVHRAVAESFCLLEVAVLPDSVWMVNKATVHKAAA